MALRDGAERLRGASGGSTGEAEVAGVRLTHPARVLYPDLGYTKLDLARYFEAVADWMVPHVRGRPLTLVRCPEGIGRSCFFMKHSRAWGPSGLRRVRIQEKTKIGEYLVADSAAALVGLAQMGVIEIHTWNSTDDHLEQPDRIVFDLDPGPDVAWREVVAAARLVRSTLEAVELRSFVKTTGGRGAHVVVPLMPRAGWSECLRFAHAIADAIARHDPRRYTTTFTKAGREDKILLDYLRNNRTNTSIAAYSTRARPGAPVSMPLDWDELSPRAASHQYTVANVAHRLRRLRQDPWKDYWRMRQSLTRRHTGALDAVG
jgi:bifunctional non-homologous end joining protein LigD